MCKRAHRVTHDGLAAPDAAAAPGGAADDGRWYVAVAV
jgi:hypothetical protein